MKKGMTLVAVVIAVIAGAGGIFYYDMNKQYVKTVSGRYFIDSDFIERFSMAYNKDKNYFDNLGIASTSDTGFTYHPPQTEISISVQIRGNSSFLIGCSKDDVKAQPKILKFDDANEYFDKVAFPDLKTRSKVKAKIYDRVFKIVGHPGY